MISVEDVRLAIDKAEDEFKKCWEILAVMKCGPIPAGFGEQFLTFQPTLAAALFGLDEFYGRLRREERVTIGNKAQIDSERFTAWMRELADFRTSIESALAVGKSIGDAFAWFFYRKSQDKIAQHLRHPSIPHTPPGIGGKAELAFLKYIRYSGFVVIYHGITSFLRIGDVSFLDLRSGEVVALGELKARKVKPGKAEVTLHMLGKDPKRVPFSGVRVDANTPQVEHHEAQKRFVERLERQIAAMRDALKVPESHSPPGIPAEPSKASLHDGYQISSLKNLADSLEKTDVVYEQAGSGLLLIGLNVLPVKSLSDRLFEAGEIDFKAALAKVVERAIKIVCFKSRDNSLRIGQIATTFLPGCAPAFWLPVEVGFLRKLYFQGTFIITVYNPAHMLERFRDLGFTVTQSKDGSSYEIERLAPPDRRFVLEHSNWFLAAIQGHLMKEEKVIECVVTILQKIQDDEIPPNTKVEIAVSTHLFPETT